MSQDLAQLKNSPRWRGFVIRAVHEWLGHESIKTTQRYTHVSGNNFNFKNLLDDIL